MCLFMASYVSMYNPDCQSRLVFTDQFFREYTRNNDSLIVDTFQGQLQSKVKCDKVRTHRTNHQSFLQYANFRHFSEEQDMMSLHKSA